MGTTNINMHETANSAEDSNSQGRALPALVLVRSISCPTTRLPATMSIAESKGNRVKKVVMFAGREPSAETVESTSAEPAPSAAYTIPETASANASTQSGQQAEPVKDANAASSTMGHGTSAPEARKPNIPKTEPETGKKIIVIVNQKPIVMRGKQSYMFVDIFDYIDFDTSRMRGSGIATLVNGRDAQYTQELYNGDKIEVYWK